jgi:hypothetical protein
MKKARLFFSVVGLILMVSSWVQPRTQEKPVSDKPASGPLSIRLDGKWRLFYFPQGKNSITDPDQLKAHGLASIEASVPGNVELDFVDESAFPTTSTSPGRKGIHSSDDGNARSLAEARAGTLMVEGTNVPAVRVPVRLVKAR